MRRIVSRPTVLLVGSGFALAVLAPAGHAPAAAAAPSSAAHNIPTSAAWTADATGRAGRWKVAKSGSGTYRVTWRSPRRLAYTDARPEVVVDGRSVGPARLSADGRTVSVTVASATRPMPADLDVLLGGKTLDQRASAGESPRVPYRRPAGLKELAVDPGARGFHAIATSGYTLDPVKLPDIPELAEMVGHVVAPTDATDSSPLVLFLHGRHEPCYKPGVGAKPATVPLAKAPDAWKCPGKQLPVPSYLGYDYVQRLLATQGYVTVSISADAINALDFYAADGGAAARAALIRDHLEQWVQFVTDGDQHADLDNVVLVGHSRGGEGADRASLNLPTDEGFTVTGQVLLGPTDFGFQAAPLTPTVTVLPYCDGDVVDLEGQNFTDDGRDLGLGLAFHSSILVMGANHNFFNTEWTPGISAAPSSDDWYGPKTKTCGLDNPARLSAAQQRKVAKTYIAGAVHLFADDDQDVLPMFDGSAVSVPSAGNADVRSHALGGGIDIRRPGTQASVGDTNGASLRLCLGVAGARSPNACEPHADWPATPHWPSSFFPGVPLRREFEMTWSAPDQTAAIDFANSWDLSGDSHLDLRTIVDPTLGRARLDVQLSDGSGGSAVVTPVTGGTLLPLPGDEFITPKLWAQTLRVPLQGVTGVDLTDIVSIDLISHTPDGRVWILDILAAPAGGITEPSGVTPLISFGDVRQDEGDGPGDATFTIPYYVAGDLAADATIKVGTVEYRLFTGFEGSSDTVVIPAHTADGTLEFSYTPNEAGDYLGQRTILAFGYGERRIQTDRYVGTATLIDDDPAPTFTVQPIDRRVPEGRTVRFRVRMNTPIAFSTLLSARPRRVVDGRQVTVGDLTKKFRKAHFYWTGAPPLDTPLLKTDLALRISISAGQGSAVISVPIRRTKSDDGPRSLSIRFRLLGVRGSQLATATVVEPKR